MRQNRSSNNHTRPWTTITHRFLGIFSSHKKRLASPCQSCRNAPASSEELSHLKPSKAISGKQISQTWSRMQVMIEMNLIYFVLLDSAWFCLKYLELISTLDRADELRAVLRPAIMCRTCWRRRRLLICLRRRLKSGDVGLSENVGYIPNEIAIFHRDNDQQNHWV